MEKPVKMAKGFKNIPSLDAITTRYARARTLSVDGTAVPPEAEPIEDPQTPGVITKSAGHLLCYVLVERSARLELDGYDSVVWHVVLEASASDTR